ncbi:hypothetical protein [Halomonas sp. E19]|uniref:hypothetical protein n=1 Tax=Halomonas sp. E19 TaxID=3397247 RepID=UPI004033AB81
MVEHLPPELGGSLDQLPEQELVQLDLEDLKAMLLMPEHQPATLGPCHQNLVLDLAVVELERSALPAVGHHFGPHLVAGALQLHRFVG